MTLPPLSEGQALDKLDLTREPALHPAAAALQRGVAGQDAGKGRHRPAEHLRLDHLDDPKKGYVEPRSGGSSPPRLGKTVTDLLVKHFPNVMDLKFTSHFEEELDDIATGKMKYEDVLNEFWTPFSEDLKKADDGDAEGQGPRDGRDVPEVRPAAGRDVQRQAEGNVRRLLRLAGQGEPVQLHQAARGRAGPERDQRRSARRAASRWSPRSSRWGTFLSCTAYKPDGTGCNTIANLGER